MTLFSMFTCLSEFMKPTAYFDFGDLLARPNLSSHEREIIEATRIHNEQAAEQKARDRASLTT